MMSTVYLLGDWRRCVHNSDHQRCMVEFKNGRGGQAIHQDASRYTFIMCMIMNLRSWEAEAR